MMIPAHFGKKLYLYAWLAVPINPLGHSRDCVAMLFDLEKKLAVTYSYHPV